MSSAQFFQTRQFSRAAPAKTVFWGWRVITWKFNTRNFSHADFANYTNQSKIILIAVKLSPTGIYFREIRIGRGIRIKINAYSSIITFFKYLGV